MGIQGSLKMIKCWIDSSLMKSTAIVSCSVRAAPRVVSSDFDINTLFDIISKYIVYYRIALVTKMAFSQSLYIKMVNIICSDIQMHSF